MKRVRIRNMPMNRNLSDDPMVIGKISVDSETRAFEEKPEKKAVKTYRSKKKPEFKSEDLLLIGLILIFLLNRKSDDDPDEPEDCESAESDGILNLNRIRKMLPIDRFSENDILLVLLLYLLF